MEINIITKEEFQHLLDRINFFSEMLKEQSAKTENEWINNEQFIAMLSISPRTAQNYRDKELISFSQVGKKIYYKLSAVNDFLENHKVPAFQPKRKGSLV